MNTRRLMVALIAAALLLAGCGPSALQQRACEMYADAGGGPETSLAFWVKWFNTPEKLAEIKADNARYAGNPYIRPETPQSRAEGQFAYGKGINEKARGIVSLRLNISLREVEEALVKCYGRTKVEKVVIPAEVVKKEEPAPLPNAAENQRQIDELLKKADRVLRTYDPPPAKVPEPTQEPGTIVFGTGLVDVNGRESFTVTGGRKVFSEGDEFAFVASFRQQTGKAKNVDAVFAKIMGDGTERRQFNYLANVSGEPWSGGVGRIGERFSDQFVGLFAAGRYSLKIFNGDIMLAEGEFSVQRKK